MPEQVENNSFPPCLKDLLLGCKDGCPSFIQSKRTFELKAGIMRSLSVQAYVETLRTSPEELIGVQESIERSSAEFNQPVNCTRSRSGERT